MNQDYLLFVKILIYRLIILIWKDGLRNQKDMREESMAANTLEQESFKKDQRSYVAKDAHLLRMKPFTYQELLPYIKVKAPKSQTDSIKRNLIMTKASSKKKRPTLLENLEHQYLEVLQWLANRQ
ncbi:hypothetical protein BGP_3651 [Beggiatoa sp. PS]|nr:hypothetical protein BGP_3651 [Beggiatoa sp. PS]